MTDVRCLKEHATGIAVSTAARQRKTGVYALGPGLADEIVEQATHVAGVLRDFGHSFLGGIELLENNHGQEYVVLLETKQRRWIVHEDIRVENEQVAAG